MAVTPASSFRFQEKPFEQSTEPKFFYDRAGHGQTYAGLLQEILTTEGVSCLLGPAGIGKTTLLRKLAEDLRAHERLVFLVTEPPASVDGLLADCRDEILNCREADLVQFHGIGAFTDFLRERLTACEAPVLVLDQAHAVSTPVVAGISELLTSEERNQSLLRLVLSGRPSLESLISSPEWRDIARLGIRQFRLGPLEPLDTSAFIRHRLGAVDCPDLMLFSTEAVNEIAYFSEGVPGRINALCRQALSIAKLKSRLPVTVEMIEQAVREDKIIEDWPPNRSRKTLLDNSTYIAPRYETQILEAIPAPEKPDASIDRNLMIEGGEPSPDQPVENGRDSVLTSVAQDAAAAMIAIEREEDVLTSVRPPRRRTRSAAVTSLLALPIAGLVLLLIFASSWTTDQLHKVWSGLHETYSAITTTGLSPQPEPTARAEGPFLNSQSKRFGFVDSNGNSDAPDTKLSTLTVAALGLPVIEATKSQTEALHPSLGRKISNIESPQRKSTETQGAMEENARELAQLNQGNQELEVNRENLRGAAANLEGGQEEAGQQLELKQKIAEAESRASRLATENARLMAELADLNQRSAASTRRLEEMELNIAALERKLSAATEQTANAEKARRQLEDLIEALSGERDELKAALVQGDADRNAMSRALSKQEANLATLGADLERANESIESLTAINQDLMDEQEVLTSKLAEAEVSRKEQKAMLAAAQDQSRLYEQERNQLREILDGIKRERAQAAAQKPSTPIEERSTTLDRPQAEPANAAAANYLSRGLELLELGDISAAQLFFDLAFEAGHGKAATALGKTYDPVYHESIKARGILARPELAIEWYEKGKESGDAEARRNLATLKAWLERAAARGDPEARRLLAR